MSKKLVKKNLIGGLIVKDQSDYDLWLKLSPKEKTQRNLNIAKSYLLSNPNISNLYNAAKAMLGGFNPKNPNIQGGIAPTPGLPAKSGTLKAAKAVKTFNADDWYKNIKINKYTRQSYDDILKLVSPEEKTSILEVIHKNPKKYFDARGFGSVSDASAAGRIRHIRQNLLKNNFTSLQRPYYIKVSAKKKTGGSIHNTFVKGVSVIDTNQDAYKHVKKRLQKRKGGTN